jgi:hypothetical protein
MHEFLLTGSDVCEVAGCSPRLLRSMAEAGALSPVEKGRRGRGHTDRYSIPQATACAYAQQNLAAGFDHATAYAAARWVIRQSPGELVKEFAAGRTVLLVNRNGRADLIEPALRPDASRGLRLLLAHLDLEKAHDRVQRRVKKLGMRPAEQAVADEKWTQEG